jgi:hypothetical protein
MTVCLLIDDVLCATSTVCFVVFFFTLRLFVTKFITLLCVSEFCGRLCYWMCSHLKADLAKALCCTSNEPIKMLVGSHLALMNTVLSMSCHLSGSGLNFVHIKFTN